MLPRPWRRRRAPGAAAHALADRVESIVTRPCLSMRSGLTLSTPSTCSSASAMGEWGAGRPHQARPVAGAHARGARARRRAAAARPAPPAPLRVRQPLERRVVVRLGRLAPPGARPDRGASLAGLLSLCCGASLSSRPASACCMHQAARGAAPSAQAGCTPAVRSSWGSRRPRGARGPQGEPGSVPGTTERKRTAYADIAPVQARAALPPPCRCASAPPVACPMSCVAACVFLQANVRTVVSDKRSRPASPEMGASVGKTFTTARPVCAHACAADPDCLTG